MKTVVGIGDALVDILIHIKNENLLKTFNLPKGGMILVERERAMRIWQATAHQTCQKTSGGSAANAIHGLAKLGISTGFIGKIGDDETGIFFKNDMVSNGIRTQLNIGTLPTGHAITLITEDTERTFAVYLGAASELNADDIHPSDLQGYDFLLLEGYLIPDRAFIEKLMSCAKSANLTVCLDMSNYLTVAENNDYFHEIISRHIDILFANEEEAQTFTGKKDPESALEEMARSCQTTVIKLGENGSLIKDGNKQIKVDAMPAQTVDTTGAGDLYASGFLFGLTQGYPLEICGKIGSITSGKVVEVIGAKMGNEKWQQIRNLIQQLT